MKPRTVRGFMFPMGRPHPTQRWPIRWQQWCTRYACGDHVSGRVLSTLLSRLIRARLAADANPGEPISSRDQLPFLLGGAEHVMAWP
jgi:hypothetical protein